MEFSNIAIIGPGLLGGSIALACHAAQHAPEVHLWARRKAAVAEALAMGICDSASTDIQTIVRNADLIILCTPVETMLHQCLAMGDAIQPTAIITDVGSVKARVIDELEPLFASRAHFIGSHPMAGSEKTGIHAAEATLFQNSACIVTPTPQSDDHALHLVKAFWQQLGCTVESLSPADHDAAMAGISHLPHVVASALTDLICSQQPSPARFCGNGFKDTTRVASGSPHMWQEILASNHTAVAESLTAMTAKLNEITTLIEQQRWNELEGFLARAKKQRDSIL